jgi:hypothetical protein
VSVWAKPEVELRVMPEESIRGFANETGKSWVLPARAGDKLYGPGHAAMALAVGRNGALVLERSSSSAPAVLVAHAPVAGWTHFAVVYDDGTPSLYIDGRHAKTGRRSGSIVHPGGAAAPVPVGVTYFFEGDSSEPGIHERALSAGEIAELADRGPPAPPWPAQPAELWLEDDGKLHALAWRPGDYRVSSGARFTASTPPPIEIRGPWQVRFPEHLGAPGRITLERLVSLRLHEDPGVRDFSGSATYGVRLDAPRLDADERVFLDLGRVEAIAEVRLNGVELGQAWSPPYRVEVTHALRAGANELEIDVTTTWTNRLIRDAQLSSPYRFQPIDGNWVAHDPGPAADSTDRVTVVQMIEAIPAWYLNREPAPDSAQVTFSTGRFYSADEPLMESGLLGPVRLIIAEHHVLE